MMKILVISHVIHPYISPRSFRTTELAKELARTGNEVTIYCSTGNSDYSFFERSHNLKIKNFQNLLFVKKDSNNTKRDSKFDKLLALLFRRVIQYPNIEFLWNIKRSLKLEKGYDLVISVGAPHSLHWGTAWALSNSPSIARKWIADCGDPFMFSIYEKPPFYFKYLEKWFCRRADHITVPVSSAINAYYPEFRSKISVIPQGFDFKATKLYHGTINNLKPTFSFAGNFYRNNRDPTSFLEYLTTIDIDFLFILYTTSIALIDPFIGKLKGKIEIRDYLPREKLLFELSKMDFLVNFENNSVTQTPSKLIDYAITTRPILSIKSNAQNFEDFLKFLDGDYSNRVIVDLDQYDIKNVTKKMLNLIAKETS